MLLSRMVLTPSQKRRILCGRSATTSRGVLEAYSSQKPQSATVQLSMWKGAPNNAEGKAKQCIGVMMSFCSILLCFLNRTFQNAEIRCSVWKQTEAQLEYSSSKADELKVEFSAEWLRIWRYERGISKICIRRIIPSVEGLYLHDLFSLFLIQHNSNFLRWELFLQSQYIHFMQTWLYMYVNPNLNTHTRTHASHTVEKCPPPPPSQLAHHGICLVKFSLSGSYLFSQNTFDLCRVDYTCMSTLNLNTHTRSQA